MFIHFKDHFENYLIDMKKRGMKDKTISEHRKMLYDYFPNHIKNKRLSKIQRSDAADLIEQGRLHGQHGPTRIIVTLRRYLNYLRLERNLKIPIDWRDIPVPKVKHREQPVFEDKEISTLFEVMEHLEAGTTPGKKMARTMSTFIEVLFSTGMRMHEPLQIKRSDFEEIKNNKELLILGKGNKERKIFFTDRCICKLQKYLEARNDTTDSMFVNSCGDKLVMSTARSYFERLKRKLKKLGYIDIAGKLKSHTFRRTLSSHLFENGADIKAVQKVMGHESERTTLRHYVRSNEKRAKIIHGMILSKFNYSSDRVRKVNTGIQVRLTDKKGRWMTLDHDASKEILSKIEHVGRL